MILATLNPACEICPAIEQYYVERRIDAGGRFIQKALNAKARAGKGLLWFLDFFAGTYCDRGAVREGVFF